MNMATNKTTVSLIKCTAKVSEPFNNILNSINNYLIRNKGAISDFNLIKDIVDRNIDNEEEAISSNLPIPLYLGLIGTMLGIIIGLMAMPSLSENNSKTDNTVQVDGYVPRLNEINTPAKHTVNQASDKTMLGVDALLAGVKIAMIASVAGLFFTTFNSFLFYSVRQKTEREKNDFFTFIQTRLLPILSRNTASSLKTLQANLLKFNDGFSSNMAQFEGILMEVRSSFESQLEVVQELKRIDVSTMAKYNINVMKEINSSFSKLKDLSDYLNNVNGLLKNTQQLNLTVSTQLDKMGDIATIVNNFDSNAKNLVDGSKYLQTHFADFEKREQALSNKMADFDSSTGEMVDALKISFEKRLQSFNEKDVEINSGFEKLFKDLKERTIKVFDDESQNIAAIKKDITKVNDNINQIKSLPSDIGGLKNSVREQDSTIKLMLEKIAEKPISFQLPKLLTYSLVFVCVMIVGTCCLFIFKYIL